MGGGLSNPSSSTSIVNCCTLMFHMEDLGTHFLEEGSANTSLLLLVEV